ncbi:2S albumin-like [Eucalyptus grandis]|uniref:2S albumin-like n=1 Tax=Eucalyptus grandis TaxID=71139 RepID=UPI00192E8286|nr:2S albumin-like [Eucalyptus grandis]
MAKLAILGAILGALLVMSRAVTANRATITTVNVDEPENQVHRGESCYEQVQRQGLEHCEQLFEDAMMYGGQGPGRPRRVHERDDAVEALQAVLPAAEADGRPLPVPGVRQVVRQQVGEFRGQGSQGMMRCASNLPNMCGFGPQYCDIRAISY